MIDRLQQAAKISVLIVSVGLLIVGTGMLMVMMGGWFGIALLFFAVLVGIVYFALWVNEEGML